MNHQYNIHIAIPADAIHDLTIQKLDKLAGYTFPGFTRFDANGGWVSYSLFLEPTVVYQVVLPDQHHDLTWSVASFAESARKNLGQIEVLVTRTPVEVYHITGKEENG